MSGSQGRREMRSSHNAPGTSESVDSRDKSIDGGEALRLIQQRHVPALRNFELHEVGVFRLHSRENGGAQNVRALAANRQQGYAAQHVPKRPEICEVNGAKLYIESAGK